ELVSSSVTSTLNGVTLAGTLDLMNVLHTARRVTVTGGLTLQQGKVEIAGGGQVAFQGTQTLGGTGDVVFTDGDAGNQVYVSTASTLTIGPEITLDGTTGSVGVAGAIMNQGAIASDGGGTITVSGISNFSGGTLTGGTWEATGQSVLQLAGVEI